MSSPGVRLVMSYRTLEEISKTADVYVRLTRPDGQPDTWVIGPVTPDRVPRFYVMATLILGGADALMLALISEVTMNEGDATVTVRFPGLEVI